MRRTNVFVVILLLFLSCIATVDAEELVTKEDLYAELGTKGYKFQKSLPKKGQILIVGKIGLFPALNRDFLASTIFKADRAASIITAVVVNGAMECFTEFEDFFFILVNIDGGKKGKKIEYIELGETLVIPFGCMDAHFGLPLNVKFRVPEGAQCVYIGSFYYKRDGYLYTITSVDVVDEYEAAVRALEERFGKGQTLVRVPSQALKE